MVRSRGVEKPKILFVGDSPGKSEDQIGEAFSGQSGQKLEELLRIVGIPQDLVRYTNIARCVPWSDQTKTGVRAPTDVEARTCLSYLWFEILQTDPEVIIPLGNTAALYLCGKQGIKRMTGRKSTLSIPNYWATTLLIELSRNPQEWMDYFPFIRSVEDAQRALSSPGTQEYTLAFSYLTQKNGEFKFFQDLNQQKQYTLIPTWHPAAILHGSGEAEGDIIATLRIAKSLALGQELIPTDGYRMLRTLPEIKEHCDFLLGRYRAGELKRISCDVETAGSNWEQGLNPYDPQARILCWGIAHALGQAVLIPYKHRESPFKGDDMAISAIRSMLIDVFHEIPVCNQSIDFDARYSAVTEGIVWKKLDFDPEQAAWWLYGVNIPKDLEFMASRFVGMFAHKAEFQAALEAAARHEIIPAEGRKKARTVKIKATYDEIPLELHHKYCCGDADAALRLSDYFEEEIRIESAKPERHLGNLDAFRAEMIDTIEIDIEMETAGTMIDRPVLDKSIQDFETSLGEIKQWFISNGYAIQVAALRHGAKNPNYIPRDEDFNLNSPEDLSILLRDVFGQPDRVFERNLPTEKKKLKAAEAGEDAIGGYKLGKDFLSAYSAWWLVQGEQGFFPASYVATVVEAITKIKAWKKDTKLFGTYIKPLPAMITSAGKIHWDYNVCHTATGRWSAFVHTIPWRSKAKEAVISSFPGGLILNADESQIEIRIGASLAKDENFLDLMRKGGDIHREVAAMVFHWNEYLVDPVRASELVTDAERRQCKTVDFGIFYGRGATAIAEANNIPLEQAKKIISDFFTRFPKIKEFAETQYRLALQTGLIWDPTGWCHVVPDMWMEMAREDRDGGYLRRIATNYPVQGWASKITQKALVRYCRKKKMLGFKSPLVMYIHDNGVTDVYPGELKPLMTLLKKEMEQNPMRLHPEILCPIVTDFEIGRCWGRQVSIEPLPDGTHLLKGKQDYFPEILDIMTSWKKPAQIIRQGVKMKNGVPVLKDDKPTYEALVLLPDWTPEQVTLPFTAA